MKQADVVVTNPPFSMFREYVEQIVSHGKQFLIIGNVNAITYKEIFKLIKENKLWLGESIHSGDREFRVPDHYPLNAAGCRVDEHGNKYIRVKGVRWFTNIDAEKSRRHEPLPLYKKYTPAEYPKYDNYDAIEVGAVADIPTDYDGTMGVPITFLDKYNPEQFEILGNDDFGYPPTKTYSAKTKVIDGVPSRSNTGALRCVLRAGAFGPGTYFNVGYPVKGVYRRVFVRRIGATA